MKNQPWLASLKATLQTSRKSESPVRLAVLGIGHELCGDDAVGVRVAEMLKPFAAQNVNLLSLEAGPAPENFTGPIRRFKPDLVLMIDSAQMDRQPGWIGWIDMQLVGGISASSHTLPLHILVTYLEAELGCRVALIGIQPRQTFADAPLSGPVRQAAEEVVRGLFESLKPG